MEGHLYIHIGPPKTATTSIQVGLQQFSDPSYVYSGARQPKIIQQLDISNVLLRYASGYLGEESTAFITAIDNIKNNIESGINVVISEEMFLVWQKESSFWSKIRKLDAALVEIPHSYIITIRDPVDALPSYYQELYSGLSIGEKWNAQQFFKHERCDCYNYVKVIRFVESLKQTIRLIHFEAITQPEVKISTILGLGCGINGSITINKENIGRKNVEGRRDLPTIDLSDFLRIDMLQPVKSFIKRRAPAAFDGMKHFSGKVNITKQQNFSLEIAEPRLSELRQSFISALEYMKN